MSYDRVIQDSDDEDDPVVGPHSPVQEYDNAHADDHLQADVQRHREIEGNYDASMNIDFDQYLQSQERLPPGHSSPQHQPPERWVPTNSGGGSMGSMMTEIGLAQQRLFDDDEVQMVDPSRQHPHEHGYSESIHAETTIPQQLEEQTSVNPTGYPYISDPSSYSAIDSNINSAQAGLSLSSNTRPNTSSLNATPPPQQYEAPLSDLYTMHTHVEVPIRPHHHDFSSIPSFDPSSAAAQTSSSSFNVFEASLPPLQNVYPEDTDHHHHNNFSNSAATVPTEVAPTSSPRRVASLQATPFSPHDTQPSPAPSAVKASRSKSENQHKSTPTSNPTPNRTAVSTPLLPTQLSTDELIAIQVPAMEIPVVEKKRGRKKKQQQEQQQQQQQEYAPSLPKSYASTTSNVIVIDDDAEDNEAAQPFTTTTDTQTPPQPPPTTTEPPNTNNKAEKRKPGRPPKNPKPAPTDPSEPLNQDPPPQPTTTDPSPNHNHNLTENNNNNNIPAESPISQTTAPAVKPKEPKKKKLKRGKTTSITLTKTYESDIEPDVLWVEEDTTKEEDARPRRGPSSAVEFPPLPAHHQSTEASSFPKASENFELVAAAAAAPAAPAPKKRGRKRKNPEPEPDTPALEEQEQIRLPEQSDTMGNPHGPDDDSLDNHLNNAHQGVREGEEQMPPPKQADPTPHPQPDPQPVETVPVTPLKPNKGPDKHSPISSSSKVPFRVGLSRRARIAPLLKVVKR
ncbi:uncharacterized protein BO72DRAFT_247085 [Aspergillus fijiensis CBS 313.89]|uniref:Uncharacterized protein n=1 Tax=Aspergillus fijiensis CBS 313.89 TaxID=1448319 RepID=A0A8G1VVJ6_9EURO|nr:uncharacterized protein BO72DRAFT_247085 [Aspergillus fijiensis CBS 313.89]RAK73246.1 hypothetical protein BO72DRAFT_247085 [Aspergillus fijiensis CBS 313.89]